MNLLWGKKMISSCKQKVSIFLSILRKKTCKKLLLLCFVSRKSQQSNIVKTTLRPKIVSWQDSPTFFKYFIPLVFFHCTSPFQSYVRLKLEAFVVFPQKKQPTKKTHVAKRLSLRYQYWSRKESSCLITPSWERGFNLWKRYGYQQTVRKFKWEFGYTMRWNIWGRELCIPLS